MSTQVIGTLLDSHFMNKSFSTFLVALAIITLAGIGRITNTMSESAAIGLLSLIVGFYFGANKKNEN